MQLLDSAGLWWEGKGSSPAAAMSCPWQRMLDWTVRCGGGRGREGGTTGGGKKTATTENTAAPSDSVQELDTTDTGMGISSAISRSWWLNIFLMFNSKTLLWDWTTKFTLKLTIKQRADFNELICSPLRYWLRQSQTTSLELKKQTIYSSWSVLGTTVKIFCAKWLMK